MNDDFLNDLFSGDFFKNHLNNMNPEDFMDEYGNIDHEKLRKESMRIFEELTGRKSDDLFDIGYLPNDNLFHSLHGDKVSMGFVQDLNSEEGKEMFDALVKQNELHKESSIINQNGEEFVQEIWTNDSETIKVKRIYKLNDNTASKILSNEEQIQIYESKLKDEVEVENYEKAAILRDKINELKNV